MESAAQPPRPYAEVEHLFYAADRHLSKVDATVRTHVMVAAADVIASCNPGALYGFMRLLVELSVPIGPRASVMGTIRRAVCLAQACDPALRQSGG